MGIWNIIKDIKFLKGRMQKMHDRPKIKDFTCDCFPSTHNSSNINTNYLLKTVLGDLHPFLFHSITIKSTEQENHWEERKLRLGAIRLVGPSSHWDWNPGPTPKPTLFSIQCTVSRLSRHGELRYQFAYSLFFFLLFSFFFSLFLPHAQKSLGSLRWGSLYVCWCRRL